MFVLDAAIKAFRPGPALRSLMGLVISLGLQALPGQGMAQTPLAINFPAAGTVFEGGQATTISWTGGDPAWSVRISLIEIAPFRSVGDAATSTPNTGSIAWTFPVLDGGGTKTCGRTFQFYVENTQRTQWAYGPVFSAAPCPFVVLSPTAGAVLVPGQPVAIKWTGGDPAWSVDLQLIDISLNQVVAGVAGGIGNSGAVTWTLPVTLPFGLQSCGRTLQFYVQNVQRTSWAHGPLFTTQPCTPSPFAIVAPPAGSLLVPGQSVTIRWTGGDPSWKVGISLVDWSVGVFDDVAANLTNTGSYAWTVPTTNRWGDSICGRTLQFVVGNMQQTSWIYGPDVFAAPCPPPNAPPIAVAGAAQSIHAGATVHLNGTASYDDNTPSSALVYAWTFSSKPAGSVATLVNATTAMPSFVADKAGTYTVRLVVTDAGGLQSSPFDVVISSFNQPPTANAGADQMVVVPQVVLLNGSASTDPDNDVIQFSWTFASKPTGSAVVLNGSTTATPYFNPDLPGVYEIALNVSDAFGQGTLDTVAITAITAATYAEQNILIADQVNNSLTPTQVTTQGNQVSLGNFLRQAALAIQAGDTSAAIDKLNKAILRSDGCERNGVPDSSGPNRDWITDCGAQAQMLAYLRAALRTLAQ